ncbi:MAG: hypothetical protein ACOZNI_31465 [Myxococcota bacterium]
MLLLQLSACAAVHQLLPEGPVLTPWERLRAFDGRASGAAYAGEPAVAFPVLPVVAWGVSYDLDLVVVDRDPWWDMHEYARIATPDGPRWLAKDARMGTLEQLLVSDLPDAETFLPELPVRRKRGAVDVVDRSTDDRVDVEIAYENHEGQRVTAHFRGPPATTPVPKRNGSTMGHSRDAVMAVLDLPWQSFGDADVTIDGKRWPLFRLLGLKPFAMSLVQTQGGLATSDFVARAADAGMALEFTLPGGTVAPTDWTTSREGGVVHVRQQTPFRTLDYAFVDDAGALELARVEVRQWGKALPPCHVELSPRLPDLRRRFAGTVRSRYVVDVGSGVGHATGWLEASWTDAGPQVRLVPEAPWWTVDRPMLTTVTYPGDGTARVRIARVPTDARSGLGGKGRSPR